MVDAPAVATQGTGAQLVAVGEIAVERDADAVAEIAAALTALGS